MTFFVSWKLNAPSRRNCRAGARRTTRGAPGRRPRPREPCSSAIVDDRVHLARDAGVVHGHDRAGALGDRRLDEALVEVERVVADVDEHRHAAAQHERVRGRHERERGHDHLVAGAIPARIAAISSADVHDVVSNARELPTWRSSQSAQRRANGPLPARWRLATASARYFDSRPVVNGWLKGIVVAIVTHQPKSSVKPKRQS